MNHIWGGKQQACQCCNRCLPVPARRVFPTAYTTQHYSPHPVPQPSILKGSKAPPFLREALKGTGTQLQAWCLVINSLLAFPYLQHSIPSTFDLQELGLVSGIAMAELYPECPLGCLLKAFSCSPKHNVCSDNMPKTHRPALPWLHVHVLVN